MAPIWTAPGITEAVTSAGRWLAREWEATASPAYGYGQYEYRSRHAATSGGPATRPKADVSPYTVLSALFTVGSRFAVTAAASMVTKVITERGTTASSTWVAADPANESLLRRLQAGGLLTGLSAVAAGLELSAEEQARLALKVKLAGQSFGGPGSARVTSVTVTKPNATSSGAPRPRPAPVYAAASPPPRLTNGDVIEWPPGFGPKPAVWPRAVVPSFAASRPVEAVPVGAPC